MERFVGFFGIFILLAITYLLSNAKTAINWRTIAGGLLLQVVFALMIIGVPSLGISGPLSPLFELANSLTNTLISYSDAGASFLFGPLVNPEKQGGLVIAFKILPTIIFFSALMSVLYHVGVMQKVVFVLAKVMQKTLGISGAESLSAAANVFVGQTEAPLIVRPYLKNMTDSEIMTLMTGGMTTVAGGVLAAYVGILSGLIPNIAGHLLTASVMSAPAAILIAKLMVPELSKPETLGQVELHDEKTTVNLVDAAANGAAEGTKLAINVGGMLIAFISLVALANGLIYWVGDFTSLNSFIGGALSVEKVLGWFFSPIAFLIGIEWNEAQIVGQLLGKKIVLNEFVAYLDLAKAGDSLSERSAIIASYALCGFANFASIAIQIGGIGGLEPSKTKVLAKFGVKSLIAGTIAACMTGAIVGILI